MPDFTMPSLGADMDRGTLTEWLVGPGDRVNRGDAVAVVETDKAEIEVECFDDGVIDALLVEPGTSVPVGAPLARLTSPEAPAAPPEPSAPEPVSGEPAPAPAPAPEPRHAATPLVRRLAEEQGVDVASVHGTGHDGRVVRADVERAARPPSRPKASPMARRIAGELGVDLGRVRGSGAGGAIRADDVRAAARTPRPPARPRRKAAAPRPAKAGRQAAMRRAIGELMARSKREIPHYYLGTTIDMSAATAWLWARNRELPVAKRLLPAALLLRASALAAREVPELNGHWLDDAFVQGDGVHLGIVTALRGGGLMTPTLRGADDLSLDELMAALKEMLVRARTGRLRGSELADATITVTDLGDQGVESVTGVIFPPQVALIGFGKIVQRPWAVEGLLGVRPVVTATLAADHRASDGHTGARLLEAVDRLLQSPEEL
ncbi:pyruvate dehydrogenase E2 component (dihydrolipoamide acetyltransferase) [Actinomadura luteofluorescens]|uniref:Dihydrolipoamide acetyltransferase component of pyruvate dehydrogenase complex n=2 Tax=Actinomadura luteofluorescens TaxID=46163 RepID=A0A7Y9JDF3_9ACTN|nr:dihydrolipoamide acetyltransferase family protein [Actinomadura luteofluorescens]NYD44992.1 pyruvate dehydrogenase E2 component (dihydrolipoamide acetyltransferase) [Actinomadura luteofluorescens]